MRWQQIEPGAEYMVQCRVGGWPRTEANPKPITSTLKRVRVLEVIDKDTVVIEFDVWKVLPSDSRRRKDVVEMSGYATKVVSQKSAGHTYKRRIGVPFAEQKMSQKRRYVAEPKQLTVPARFVSHLAPAKAVA